MASPARYISGLPQRSVSVRTHFTIPAAKWAYIMGQQPAFLPTGDTLTISKCEGLRACKGVVLAVAFEAVGVICALGLWRLLR